jgi:hypothetical protein
MTKRKVYERDKNKQKVYSRECYLRNQEKHRSRSLAYYHSNKRLEKNIRKGIVAYLFVMRDFYTKSHRLECYKQLVKDMKQLKLQIAA